MKRWWLVIGLLLSLGVNAGIVVALAAGRFHRQEARHRLPFEGPMHDARNLARGMGLDAENEEDFRELHHRFFTAAREQRQVSMELRRELLGEVTSGEPDREEIDDILLRISESELEMERALVATMLEARDLLDPGQEQRYVRFLGSRLMRMDHGGGPPRGPGHSPGSIGGRDRRHPGGGRPGGGRGEGKRGPGDR